MIGPPDVLLGDPAAYVAAEVTSNPAGWEGVSVRSYRTTAGEVVVPPVDDYTLLLFPDRPLAMERKIDGRWTAQTVAPGSVSPLTRDVVSHWVWDGGATGVTSVHLGAHELHRVAEQLYDRPVDDIALVDRLDARDPELFHAVLTLTAEADGGGLGSRLLVESARTAIAVRLLRGQARVRFREPAAPGGLTRSQERRIRAYVCDNLRTPLTLEELAAAVSLSRFHFCRAFRLTTGLSPHQYVLRLRTARAVELIDRTDLPLHWVATECGFADQSHLTRVFKARLGTTPAKYRDRAS